MENIGTFKRITNRLLVAIFFLYAHIAVAQTLISKEALRDIVVENPYHCDSITKQRQQYMSLCEGSMALSYLKYKKSKRRIKLSGQLVEKKSNEPMPFCEVSVLDGFCSPEKIQLTDQDGKFNFTISYKESKSINFTCIGFRDIELFISKLK